MAPLQWLIDGHNLIGQLQDLELDDPHDEAKLTMAVKSYCMRGRCKATIIFDNGLPGGVSRELSSYDVTVIFAPPRTQADTLLMRRAREIGNGNLRDIILVTSDNRILRLAHAYGLETMSSEEFALLLGFRPVEVDSEEQKRLGKKTAIRIVYEKNPNPVVTQDEIAYWLPIFKRKLAMVRLAHAQGRVAERARREEQREAAKLEKKQLKHGASRAAKADRTSAAARPATEAPPAPVPLPPSESKPGPGAVSSPPTAAASPQTPPQTPLNPPRPASAPAAKAQPPSREASESAEPDLSFPELLRSTADIDKDQDDAEEQGVSRRTARRRPPKTGRH